MRSEADILCKELGEHHRAPLEFFTVNPRGKGHGKVSVFPALSCVSGRDNNLDTIRIAAEKRTIEIGADLMSTPTAQHLAAYWMEKRNLWSPGDTQLRLR